MPTNEQGIKSEQEQLRKYPWLPCRMEVTSKLIHYASEEEKARDIASKIPWIQFHYAASPLSVAIYEQIMLDEEYKQYDSLSLTDNQKSGRELMEAGYSGLVTSLRQQGKISSEEEIAMMVETFKLLDGEALLGELNEYAHSLAQ